MNKMINDSLNQIAPLDNRLTLVEETLRKKINDFKIRSQENIALLTPVKRDVEGEEGFPLC